MRPVFLVLFLWVVACAHPVPSQDSTRPRRGAQQEDIANEGDINELGGGDDRHPPAHVERGDNALAGDLAGGNAVGKELSSQDEGDRAREVQHLNQVDHEDRNARWENSLGFLEEDARDAADGDDGEHPGTGRDGLPSHAGGLLDEEDDSGDDTFDANREEEERGEGPTYVAGADGAGEDGHDFGRGDAGAGRGHGDSSSSSSSESISADHRQYRNYRGSWYERTYRQGGGSSSSQEEESYDFEDEAMQGDDPSVFDGPGSNYKGHRSGPRALGSSQESIRRAGSYHWEEGNSRSPEMGDTQSEEDSPSVEDKSQSEEPTSSQSEENSPSQSEEEEGDREDSRSREGEGSKSRDEELGDSPEDISQEVVSTSSEHRDSQSQEEQEDRESAEDRSVPSEEEQGDQSESGEDDGDQSQSPEDTREDSQENRNDSNPDEDVPSTSAESQSASPEDDGSQEDDAGEDSRSTESNNSESREDDHDDDEESHSQEDATRESSSRGDDSSLQSLESGSRMRRPGALRNKPAADYDDNDCQDGY
ncbi:dentin matrix acidic phosphoprotein 1-like [Patagioenas fasciata monilis]|uniref:Dentin matrix acidic phosphoprotein 1-like n=1 Tax=Patagioenas fasciata monilis TaxID=372326 RepID=A0A1V4JUQ9_PATFA|nr:dentin matrix acidic phosphoprotein 1-like [Patagioenas fasciata monilis]